MFTNTLNNFNNSLIFVDTYHLLAYRGPHLYTSFNQLSQYHHIIESMLKTAKVNTPVFQKLVNTFTTYKVPKEILSTLPKQAYIAWNHGLVGVDLTVNGKVHTLLSTLTKHRETVIYTKESLTNILLFPKQPGGVPTYLNPLVVVIEKHNLILEACKLFNLEFNEENKQKIVKIMIDAYIKGKYTYVN